MATVIAVHGTFANVESDPGSGTGAAGVRQWWQPGSAFEQELRSLLAPDGAELKVEPFTWSGDNSEIARREAGRKLLERLHELEARKETYCLVGHSHGGSVISAALLESAAKREPLAGLKRWITIGTPFVSLQRERFLFTRLDLRRKVIFVASMMLLLMFLIYLVADILSGPGMLIGGSFPGVLAITGGMMSLPAIVCYLVFKYLDSFNLLHYRRSVKARAREHFASRWRSLTHPEDEAVQGLTFLPGAKLSFFDKAFAVQSITLISVFALPLIYLSVLMSPTTMVEIGDWLRTHLYDAHSSPQAEKALRDLRQRLRSPQQTLSSQGTTRTASAASDASPSAEQRTVDAAERRAFWLQYRNMRRDLETRYPDLRGAERALRFKQRFFEQAGKPCAAGKLCGAGRDLHVNSGLLLHVVTDELSWALGAEEADGWLNRWLWSLLLPAVLVPIISVLVALGIMLLIQAIARVVSDVTSNMLNRLTNAEVKRAAFGNDTEGEIALSAIDRPVWIDQSPPRLPAGVADLVTGYSNAVATQSLAKFRKAIGKFAAADPRQAANSAITTYFTWKELVHASYFDVPEFRKLIAHVLSGAEGFAASPQFRADPDYPRTAQWLAEIEGMKEAPKAPADAKPTASDAGAVAAVVASTVKVEP